MAMQSLARRGLIMLAAGAIMAVATRSVLADDAVSQEAKDAVARMGKSLASGGFSFQAAAFREYQKDNLPLHIFHASDVTVRRPDRLRVDVNGDDGRAEIGYDGKTLTVYNLQAKRYATIPITGSVEAMLRTASERMGLDFPLADLLADEPGRSFLDGVVMGTKVGEVTIDGQACNHFFFMQPPGIELELWSEANDRGLPRRIAVTYRSIPGEPQMLAEMSNWKLGLNPPDSAFVLKVPADATKAEIQEKTQ
jgi:hypothetical protein